VVVEKKEWSGLSASEKMGVKELGYNKNSWTAMLAVGREEVKALKDHDDEDKGEEDTEEL
jgi:hypothetical protein